MQRTARTHTHGQTDRQAGRQAHRQTHVVQLLCQQRLSHHANEQDVVAVEDVGEVRAFEVSVEEAAKQRRKRGALQQTKHTDPAGNGVTAANGRGNEQENE